MAQLFAREKFPRVVHLAAQAGVRYSLENPHAYVRSNVTGTLNVLEGCRHNGVEHLVYASTSSVYGANTNMPFSVHNDRRPSAVAVRRHQARQRADGAQLLGAVQAADHRAALLHRLWSLGPPGHGAVPVHAQHPRGQADRRVQQRPPPARLHLRRGHRRGVVRALRAHRAARPRLEQQRAGPGLEQRAVPPLQHRQQPAGASCCATSRCIEECLGRKAQKNLLPLQPGDVPETFADIDDLVRDVGYRPATPDRGRRAATSSTGSASTTATSAERS